MKGFKLVVYHLCVLIITAFGCASLSASATELKAEVIEFGYYQPIDDIKPSRSSSTSGYSVKGGQVVLVKQTEQIPNIQHQLFGFRFRISGFDKSAKQGWLRLVVKHPLIIRPNGSRSEGYSYPVSLAVNEGVTEDRAGYQLTHKYEMVQGEWSFQFRDKDSIVLEQKFIVRAPNDEDFKLIGTVKRDIEAKIKQGLFGAQQAQKSNQTTKTPGKKQ